MQLVGALRIDLLAFFVILLTPSISSAQNSSNQLSFSPTPSIYADLEDMPQVLRSTKAPSTVTHNEALPYTYRPPQVPLDVKGYPIAPNELKLEQVHVYVRHGMLKYCPVLRLDLKESRRRAIACRHSSRFIYTRALDNVQNRPSVQKSCIGKPRRSRRNLAHETSCGTKRWLSGGWLVVRARPFARIYFFLTKCLVISRPSFFLCWLVGIQCKACLESSQTSDGR